MSPSEHFQMLKRAEFDPSGPPTMETMKDSRGWFGRNAGTAAATGVEAGALGLGLAGAIPTVGLSLLPAAALGIGGMIYDHFGKKRELARQTNNWYSQDHANFMKSLRDGSAFNEGGGGMQGLIGQTQAYTKTLPHPAAIPAPMKPTQAPQQPAPAAPPPVQPAAPPPTPSQ